MVYVGGCNVHHASEFKKSYLDNVHIHPNFISTTGMHME